MAGNFDLKGSRGSLAIKRTDRRRPGAKKKIKLDTPMWSRIQSRLGEYYRPAQISGRLQLALVVEISHEAICRHIWADKKSGGGLYNFWRTKGKKYRLRGRKKGHRRPIKNAVSIDERPAMVDEKNQIGDGEIEIVIGQNDQPALVTIVERKSKLTVMKKVENRQQNWWPPRQLSCYALIRIGS